MARKIASVYLLAGLAWILFGASVLDALNLDSHWSGEALRWLEILKGGLYVLVTAVLLYLYLDFTFKKLQKAEKQAIDARRQMEEVMESISDGFFALDHQWRFTYINSNCRQIFHREPTALLHTPIWTQFPELVSQPFYTHLQQAFASRETLRFEEKLVNNSHWLAISVYPMQDGISVFIRDITESHRLREQIARQRQNLSTLINSSRDSIWSIDRNYRLISANEAFYTGIRQLLGHDLQEGSSLLGIENLDEGFVRRWMGYYTRAFRGETLDLMDVVDRGPDRPPLYLEMRVFPIFDEQQACVGLSCYAHDVTEREEHLRRIREQNDQLTGIAWIQSHKLRVPVAQILGLVSVLNSKNPGDPFNGMALEKLEIAATELDKIIHEIVSETGEPRRKEA